MHYARTRIPPEEYYKRRFEMNKGGLGFIGVRYERQPDGFHFARVWFPRDFQHLTNDEGQRLKAATNAGYHVSLGYDNTFNNNSAAKEALYRFISKYGNYKKMLVKDVNVSSGDTYEIIGHSPFAKDIRDVTDIALAHKGPGYIPHISLD